ncbi:Dabb family protein [Rosistilla oblonga]|uniref:Dabb family protein n=1 Tax=Rosistilla oblonga TaxID=2527990 RepID=UPI003A96C023
MNSLCFRGGSLDTPALPFTYRLVGAPRLLASAGTDHQQPTHLNYLPDHASTGSPLTMPQLPIEHTVTFQLSHPAGSAAESDFLAAAAELASIPNVHNFQIRRQTSPKNPHRFGISMWFETAEHFAAYCDHPAHFEFVQERWLKEVTDFQESDFEPLA